MKPILIPLPDRRTTRWLPGSVGALEDRACFPRSAKHLPPGAGVRLRTVTDVSATGAMGLFLRLVG